MIDIPDPGSIDGVADWIELSICTTRAGLSKAAVAAALESAAGEEPQESFLSYVWNELEYRQQLYAPPFFKVLDRTIEPTASSPSQPTVEYLTCLVLSLYGVQPGSQAPSKLFERLSCEAIKKYLSGKAVVFGWPFEAEDREDDETLLQRKVKNLAADLREEYGVDPASHFKDRGLDVVGWIPTSEERSSQVVILVQCTTEHHWKGKSPVPINAWIQYIRWASDPIRAFAVPCVIKRRDWHDKSRDNGMLFDRIRIVNLLSDGADDKELRQELNAWVEKQLADFNE